VNTTLYGSSLREHGTHLQKLSTKLTATFRQLEQAFDEQQSPGETNTARFLEGTVELNNNLFAAMVFCQSLQVFLGRGKRGKGLTSES